MPVEHVRAEGAPQEIPAASSPALACEESDVAPDFDELCVQGRRILLVDDNRTNLNVLVDILKLDYKLGVAINGPKALEYAGVHKPDLVLLDVMMPDMDGFEVCRRLKAAPETREIPVIFISAVREGKNKAKGFAVGGVDYVTKPFDGLEVKARVRTHLSLKCAQERLRNQNALLDKRVRERTRELHDTQIEVVTRLCLAAEFRDSETGHHVKRISHYCECIAEQMGMNAADRDMFFYAASMHDVGKIGIPDHILLKPGPLDAAEWEIMKTHTVIGARMLEDGASSLIRMARDIALTHHERWDGQGYPGGLARESIPLAGRITALCDVFDALTSARPYKAPWPITKAVSEVAAGKGTQFDPDVVNAFRSRLDFFVDIKHRFADEGLPPDGAGDG